jgi:two-component system chemotaxis response regulator CheB
VTDDCIRVVLIDDSTVVRGALRQIIDATPDIRVVNTAGNGRLGLAALDRTPADVVMLDIEMPEMDGLATLPQILARHPSVRVIMASSLTQRGAQVTIDALALGAADYITKPTARAGPSQLAALADEICGKIRALIGRKRVVRRVQAPTPPRPMPVGRPRLNLVGFSKPKVIAIASSTGGPNALATVLASLPKSLTLPVLVTQHMPPVFTTLLAQRLQREAGRTCVEAEDGMPIGDNCTYLAPGDFHMLVEPKAGAPYIRLSQAAPENHCRPAADPMMRSIVAWYGSATLAVVLTGMGEDGRRGCEVVHEHGGRVIVQDEATSIVWGMPGAVAGAGLADGIYPLRELGGEIGVLCGRAA